MIAPEALIPALTRYFEEHPDLGVASAYLFGSQAEGRAHRESDVDVGVLLQWDRHPTADDRFEMRVRLGSDLIAVVHHNEVDVVVLNDAPPLLGRKVIYGIRVFRGDPETDHAYVRDVQILAADLEPWLNRMRKARLEALALRLHLEHLRELRLRVTDPVTLRNDLSLRNDVLHSLQTVCQIVIDIASELSARYLLRFQDYTEAVRNLSSIPGLPPAAVRALEKLPGFRNVLIHEYVTLDYKRVIEVLDRLGDVEELAEAIRRLEAPRSES
jgi:uncharacterized protein YutE (UPF0331/DUF86 family)/predicted nucleotidyltransferase